MLSIVHTVLVYCDSNLIKQTIHCQNTTT